MPPVPSVPGDKIVRALEKLGFKPGTWGRLAAKAAAPTSAHLAMASVRESGAAGNGSPEGSADGGSSRTGLSDGPIVTIRAPAAMAATPTFGAGRERRCIHDAMLLITGMPRPPRIRRKCRLPWTISPWSRCRVRVCVWMTGRRSGGGVQGLDGSPDLSEFGLVPSKAPQGDRVQRD
jgi:hypothetical protein